MPVILKDKIYIPCKFVEEDTAREKYTFRFYDDAICNKCVFRRDRHCADCDACEFGGLKDQVSTMSYKVIKGEPYFGFPMGDLDRIEEKLDLDFDELGIKDFTCKEKFSPDFKPKMSIKLYEYQDHAVLDLQRGKLGGLQSKPRTGKCVDGRSKVNTGIGYMNISRLWDLYGVEGKETVKIDLPVTTRRGVENATHLHRKRSKTIKIRTDANHALRGTPEHPVLVATPDLKLEWKRLDALAVGDWVTMVKGEELLQTMPKPLLQIPQESTVKNVKNIKQPKFMSPELAYVMGCLVANGRLGDALRYGSIVMDTNNQKVADKYKAYIKSIFGLDVRSKPYVGGTGHETLKHIVNSVYMQRFLAVNDLGMCHSRKKYIPESVLRSNKDCILGFLSGYISSDSETLTVGSELILSTASPRLHADLRSLLLCLGVSGRSRISEKAASNGSGILRKYGSLALTSDNKDKLLSIIDLDKDCYTVENPKSDSDSDRIPFLAEGIRSLSASTRKSMYGGRKQTLAESGHMARTTMERIDWDACGNASIQKFVKAAGKYVFQQVTDIEHFDTETYVYDLTVEGSHSFIANGFVVHNTTMAVNLMFRLGYKVVVLANQKDYLDGFARELSEHTNIDQLEKELGRKLYGFPKKDEDWENFEILLVTYQSLIQDSDTHRWRMNMIRKHRGLTIVDEAHKGNARSFASVLTKVTSRSRIALTATFRRKDSRHVIVRHVMGPILHKTHADVLKPIMTIHKAPTGKTRAKFTGMGGWSRLTKFLSLDRDRNNYILDAVMRDIDRGRSIAIPVYHVDHAKFLVREINYRYGDEIAATFLGGTKEAKKREDTIKRARAGEIKVVVGIRSLIQTGINIAAWSCLYNIMPMNNQPNWEQESYRICTPMEGKRTPLIRFFADEMFVQAFGCFKHTVCQSLALGHTLTPISAEKAKAYGINLETVKGDRRYQNSDAGLGRSL